MKTETLLLVLVLCLAAYDGRTQLVPNWVTLPLLIVGLILHFPGLAITWLVCLLLFWAWYVGGIGGGDAKLWMALLWLIPTNLVQPAVLVMAVVFLSTSSIQLVWRMLRGCSIFGVRGPGAWRAIPFALWLIIVSQKI